VEEHEVAVVRVVAEARVVAGERPPAVGPWQEDPRQPR